MSCRVAICVHETCAKESQLPSRLILTLVILFLACLTACAGYSAGASGSQNQTTVTPAAPAANNGKSFTHVEASAGWGQYGQGPPIFVDCSPSPCNGISFGMTQGINSPSMSGAATQFNLGGTAVYSDALFNNHLIGALSSQGKVDSAGTMVSTLHTFTYDVYFYGQNLKVSQALEFDVNQFFNGMGFIWGNECRIAGGNEWDVWDNQQAKWTPTGVACNPLDNSWNHVTIQVQRTANNELLYKSITLNGQAHNLNLTFPAGTVSSSWYGVTINYQMDGNFKQDAYAVLLDNLTFSYE